MALDEAQSRAPLVTFFLLISYFFSTYLCCAKTTYRMLQNLTFHFYDTLLYFCSIFFLIPYTVFLGPSRSCHPSSFLW